MSAKVIGEEMNYKVIFENEELNPLEFISFCFKRTVVEIIRILMVTYKSINFYETEDGKVNFFFFSKYEALKLIERTKETYEQRHNI